MNAGLRKSRQDRTVGLSRWTVVVVFLLALGWWSNLRFGAERPENAVVLQTNAFAPGGEIPRKFTCQGPDVSPALTWNAPPAATRSFALIADDPDAPNGTFVHWVVYNLPATARQLPETVPGREEISGGGRQGVNDFPHTGYNGPCPPPGKYHRYFFHLYALDTVLNIKAGATRQEVDQAMKGHVLAQAEVMGRFRR